MEDLILEERALISVEAPIDRESVDESQESFISFRSELPLPLQQAMTTFIENYPNWDQYRLVQAALAGFLVQNGVDSREITRLYVGSMFGNPSYK